MHSKHNVLTSIPNLAHLRHYSVSCVNKFRWPQLMRLVKVWRNKTKKGGTDQTDLWCEMESQQQNSDDCDAQFLHDGWDSVLLGRENVNGTGDQAFAFFIPPSDVINHAKTPAFMYHSATNVIYFYLATNYAFCVIVNRIRNKNKWIAKLLNAYLIN